MKGKFIPEISRENVSYPGKKIPRPGPTQNKIPQPNPTRPENILKNVPRPRTGPNPGFGLPRRSLIQTGKFKALKHSCEHISDFLHHEAVNSHVKGVYGALIAY